MVAVGERSALGWMNIKRQTGRDAIQGAHRVRCGDELRDFGLGVGGFLDFAILGANDEGGGDEADDGVSVQVGAGC